MAILTFHNLRQSFADIDIFVGLTASIAHGARIGLVGPNGIGKTTLLRILAGESRPAEGIMHLAKGARVGYSQQEAMRAFTDQTHTIYQEMLTVFAGIQQQEAALRQMERSMSAGDSSEEMLEAYGRAQETFELAGGYDYDLRIQQVLDGLGLTREHWQMPLSHCSGGQKTRALLARLLLEEPDLLILDEPTNHLDVAAIEWLEGRLRSWAGTLLIVSHDRYFLDTVANNIWEMSRGGIETYRGNYSAYMVQREERWAQRDEEFRTVKERFLKELDFVKKNIARESSTDQAKGRLRRLVRQVKAVEIGGSEVLNQNWSMGPGVSGEKWNVAEVEGRIKGLRSPNPGQAQLKMRLHPSQRSGRVVLKSKGSLIGYPGVPLFQIGELELHRKECAALIGPNGSGKSTFLRTLMGEIEPLRGKIRHGSSLDISYFAQAHDQIDLDRSVLDELLAYRYMPTSQARSYLARFLFRGEDVYKLNRTLSGGERGRLALAIMSLDNSNFLLLDEPTNHLDIPAQEVLQDALGHFEGTTLLVTHDRYLVDKLATQIWELRDGGLHVHHGSYQSFLTARAKAEALSKEIRSTEKQVERRADAGVKSSARKQVKALDETEAAIGEMESTLHLLNLELEAATQAQQWEAISQLSQQYHAAQHKLEGLMHQWEKLTAAAGA